MASRLPHGAALLVAGYGRVGAPGLPPPALQTLGQIGETLLATAAPWRIRRLSPAVGDRLTPDRASLKRYLGELTELPVDVVIVAVAGVVTNVLGEPALVTGVHHRELPEDATLPLRWIGERLGACRAGSVLVVLSAQSDDHPSGPEAWLEALRTGHPKHVVAAHDARDDGAALDALLAGLYGNAIDPTTGTITLRSISEHLARSVAGLALQRSFDLLLVAQLQQGAVKITLARDTVSTGPRKPRHPTPPRDSRATTRPRLRLTRPASVPRRFLP